MTDSDREWLLTHLSQQADELVALAERARAQPQSPEALVVIRDGVFTIRETLDTLGVPLALVSNADWNRAIGTTPDIRTPPSR